MKSWVQHLLDSRTILVVGTDQDSRLLELGSELRGLASSARLILLRPVRENAPAESPYDQIITASSDSLSCADLAAAPRADAAVLAIPHTQKADYAPLVRMLCNLTFRTYIYTACGLQPVDMRDATSEWPEDIVRQSRARGLSPKAVLFFRAYDQPARLLARQYQDDGAHVLQVETLAALEQALPDSDTVFFDWGVCDYGILFPALQLAADAQRRIEAYISLDMADTAEDIGIRETIIALNESALSALDYAYLLTTRSFLADRYELARDQHVRLNNVADAEVWSAPNPPPPSPAPLRLVYHGRRFFWHELDAFAPVYRELAARSHATLDIFGTPHDPVTLGGVPLFPVRERQVAQAMNELKSCPGVAFRGDLPAPQMKTAIAGSHYYVGITAGSSLMSRTAMRTGLLEARHTPCRLLHKTTCGVLEAGWNAGSDYLDVDAAQPSLAADIILDDHLTRSRG